MKVFTAVSLATLVGYSQAGCPNSCSGHGTCGVDEVVSLFLSLILKKSSSSSQPPSSVFSALATLDGVPMVWLEEIALRDSVPLNWLG